MDVIFVRITRVPVENRVGRVEHTSVFQAQILQKYKKLNDGGRMVL